MINIKNLKLEEFPIEEGQIESSKKYGHYYLVYGIHLKGQSIGGNYLEETLLEYFTTEKVANEYYINEVVPKLTQKQTDYEVGNSTAIYVKVWNVETIKMTIKPLKVYFK